MNNITLAHIGGDLVLIGGVAFYFHRKTAALSEEILTLKKENKLLSDAIVELQENFQQLGDAFMQLQGAGGPQQQPQRVQVPPQRRPQQTSQRPPQRQPQPAAQPGALGMMDMMQGFMQQQPVQQPTLRKPKRSPKSRRADPEDSGIETLDDRDLDKELDTEYQELEKQRGNCEGDVCTMPE